VRELTESVKLISLQFSFTNPEAVPASVRRVAREELAARFARKDKEGTGFLVINPTEKCSILQFLDELESAGYELIYSHHQERPDGKDARGKRVYQMVRFQFALKGATEVSPEFLAVRDAVRADLRNICRLAMWRVRAFSNPLYHHGEVVPEKRSMSINLEFRQPYAHPDGTPVVVWQKDEYGQRVGDAAQPISPEYALSIVAGAVDLI